MVSENARAIINFLRDNEGDYTYVDVADALGLPGKTVNGCFTALQTRKITVDGEKVPEPWGYREPVTIEVDDTDKEGNAIKTTKEIKFLRLTEKGKTVDIDALNAAEVAAKEAIKAEKAAAKAAKEAAKAAE